MALSRFSYVELLFIRSAKTGNYLAKNKYNYMYVLGMYLSHLHSEVNRNYEIQTEFTVLGKWPRLCRRSNPSLRHIRMPMVCSRCRMRTRPNRRRLELLKLNNHAWDITQKLTGSYLLGIFKHAPYALTESLNVFEKYLRHPCSSTFPSQSGSPSHFHEFGKQEL